MDFIPKVCCFTVFSGQYREFITLWVVYQTLLIWQDLNSKSPSIRSILLSLCSLPPLLAFSWVPESPLLCAVRNHKSQDLSRMECML